jgi:hypothetical protein
MLSKAIGSLAHVASKKDTWCLQHTPVVNNLVVTHQMLASGEMEKMEHYVFVDNLFAIDS